MSKTPVMVLQELMVKIGTKGLPMYELTHNGGGTHQNSFTIRVTCGDVTASGSGSNKKLAKHEAAKAMLAQMGVGDCQYVQTATPPQSPARPSIMMAATSTLPIQPAEVQSSSAPFVNAIGHLQELFNVNKLKEPTYIESCTDGPPHLRVFTIQCCVGDIVEEGVAKTKKQAKQEAAMKMLQHVQGQILNLQPVPSDKRQPANGSSLIEEPSNLQIMDLKIEEPMVMGTAADELAMERYKELSKMPVAETSKVLISDYHTHLKTIYDDEIRYALIKSLDFMINEMKKSSLRSLDQLKVAFQKILMSLNLTYDRKIFKSTESINKLMVAIRLNSKPTIVEVGYAESEDSAEKEAILRAMVALKLLLK